MKGNFFYQRLGERLISEREKKSLSQEQLGLIAEIDRTYIARIENGRANPTIKILCKIAKSLKIKLSKLLRGV
ncbi:transcriptional regulator [Candidatus Roizmanbacteria bacterium CG02_land_8_20_14_3_00_36_15]|uniref:Transcriptional regulator n=2 Tax=Candidatus Roizmaniibacteriota TaxID=1752723 RepID=A0A2M8KLF9_9BACT|nr:MAG: transcriptional regulator [Candidatus Roizmanbacteria bacterium CG03_land_8_20_14_0_80_36_21]PIV37717.1 MAG: transcriptional regulator [Candidatus Roizmanbacteria bacterium CG02_land_8_20_14_3_00_36_15]PIY69674.1 MAG: transcriptional regulator [Candidatus Roizmanbacteria bacterium CG_4_10_14_0_8_um_filter_36_36]PJA53547.1 MAG: transcriptional regulator [Candidatus Roizmanbacteria bacterium CG_4_9_14_3_um_filter_36_11]PJC81825.1 MAG: transcriptional regulator [Candidatus Roizmanbacteria 